MAQVSVYNMEGKEVGKMDLLDDIFGIEVNEHLVHMAVVQHLANMRQGTQKAKTRSEVSGGGAKPWRQKGTGHARQGSTRSPQWRHGGVVFAPVPSMQAMPSSWPQSARAAPSRSLFASICSASGNAVFNKRTIFSSNSGRTPLP